MESGHGTTAQNVQKSDINAISTMTHLGNPLMTPKALALSLTPPRVPPFGTVQRALYNHSPTNNNHKKTKHLYDVATSSSKVLLRHHNNKNHNHYHVRPIETKTSYTKTMDTITTTTLQQQLQHLCVYQQHQNGESATKRRGRRNHTITTKYNYHYPRQHPYMFHRSNDQVTRSLLGSGIVLSLEQQNSLRDAGVFRYIVDLLATITIPPMLLLSHPPSKLLLPYLKLRQICETIPYGPDPTYQYIHLYSSPQLRKKPQHHQHSSSSSSQQQQHQRRLITFIHGGAWGSGQPWMYSLVATPFLFDTTNDRSILVSQSYQSQYCYSVAVIGHRTYPNGSTLLEQVSDIRTALNLLLEQHTYLYDNSNVTLMGHSSGAHVALSMVVDLITEKLNTIQQKVDNGEHNPTEPIPIIDDTLPFDSFCGISGPYDISHHFDYESARGVEEVSPMKPVNGYTRQSLQANSPLWRLSNETIKYLYPNVESILEHICPNIALIHGIEDGTVPFTATAEAATRLRRLGVETKVQEIYIPHTGHQDTILQLMLGGPTCSVMMEWISSLQNTSNRTNQVQILTKCRSRL